MTFDKPFLIAITSSNKKYLLYLIKAAYFPINEALTVPVLSPINIFFFLISYPVLD